MLQVSRSGSLKIPKKVEIVEKVINTNKDVLEVKKAYFTALDKKFNEEKELDVIFKIPNNSNDLIVITVVKKLGAYITTITQKSPKKFRGVFVNRMQNYCLDTL